MCIIIGAGLLAWAMLVLSSFLIIGWALVELAIEFFRKREGTGIEYGANPLADKIVRALKDETPAIPVTVRAHEYYEPLRRLSEAPVERRVEDSVYARKERDRDGFVIPAEYPPHFDRNAWCWPGFWFSALWCCYKGIENEAWKYIFLSMIPFVGLPLACIVCGTVGYREYSGFINESASEDVGRAKANGLGCFAVLLLTALICGLPLLVILAIAIAAVILEH